MSSFPWKNSGDAKSLLNAAKGNLRENKYEDAEACARMALDSFLLVRDDVGFFQEAFQGIQEASGIAIEARRRWVESGYSPSPEVVDRLREKVCQETDELDLGFCAAVRAAIDSSEVS